MKVLYRKIKYNGCNVQSNARYRVVTSRSAAPKQQLFTYIILHFYISTITVRYKICTNQCDNYAKPLVIYKSIRILLRILLQLL